MQARELQEEVQREQLKRAREMVMRNRFVGFFSGAEVECEAN